MLIKYPQLYQRQTTITLFFTLGYVLWKLSWKELNNNLHGIPQHHNLGSSFQLNRATLLSSLPYDLGITNAWCSPNKQSHWDVYHMPSLIGLESRKFLMNNSHCESNHVILLLEWNLPPGLLSPFQICVLASETLNKLSIAWKFSLHVCPCPLCSFTLCWVNEINWVFSGWNLGT
jgi:hypothetical protein